MLIVCSAVWALIGLGVCLDASRGYHPDLFHTHLPLWLRTGGWWVTAAVGIYGAFSRKHVPLVVGALMLMPLQRVLSYGWSWIVALIPGMPEGILHGWYSAGYYVLMCAFVLMVANVKEPTRDGGL